MTDLNATGQFMAEQAEKVASAVLNNTRKLAASIDDKTGVRNFGVNIMINALAHALEETMADFAQQAGRDRDKSFAEFSEAFHHYINDWIAKFSKTGVAVMLDIRDKDHPVQ